NGCVCTPARWYPRAPATIAWLPVGEVTDDCLHGGRRVAPRFGLNRGLSSFRRIPGRDAFFHRFVVPEDPACHAINAIAENAIAPPRSGAATAAWTCRRAPLERSIATTAPTVCGAATSTTTAQETGAR